MIYMGAFVRVAGAHKLITAHEVRRNSTKVTECVCGEGLEHKPQAVNREPTCGVEVLSFTRAAADLNSEDLFKQPAVGRTFNGSLESPRNRCDTLGSG